ncbi:S1 family peptidase [Dyella thiooxydans]|uniref:S1 family peptidase n=1 Tax=Dyella thiooxydans TaxID=445710 RepID=UPI000A02A5DE|nr:serine protease [Dyella thiooxydans]
MMRNVYLKAKSAIAYVAVETSDGDESIGTAFHIGDGYFVTAKHVLDGNRVQEVSITQPLIANTCYHDNHLNEQIRPRTLKVIGGPWLADGDIDVAVIRVDAAEDIPAIKMDSIHDIYQSEDIRLLSPVICIGYPPIPLTTHPFQVAVDGKINALVRVRGSSYLTYVISATSRGGFSGGPVIDEAGLAIGLVTESLVRDNHPVEAGFFTCLSISAAADLAIRSGWSPDDSVFYRDIESLAWVKLAMPETVRLNPHAHDASIYVYDDDRDVIITFSSHDQNALSIAESAFASICPLHERELVNDQWIWTPKNNSPASELKHAAIAARDALIATGFCIVAERFSGGRGDA